MRPVLIALVCLIAIPACSDDEAGAPSTRGLKNPDRDPDPSLIVRFDKLEAINARPAACSSPDRVQFDFVVLDSDRLSLWPGDVVDENDAVRDLQLSVAEGQVSAASPAALIRCPTACESEADCSNQAGRYCSAGWCASTPDAEPSARHAACLAAGLDTCRSLTTDDPLDVAFAAAASEVAFCRTGCATDGDCTDGDRCLQDDAGESYCSLSAPGPYCDDDSGCATGYACETFDAPTRRKACVRQLDVAVVEDSVEFHAPPDREVIALVMDNSGSLFGRGVTEDDRTVRLDRATDPDLFRIAAAKGFVLHHAARPSAQGDLMSVWSFQGTTDAGVTPLTGLIDGPVVQPYVDNLDPAGPVHIALDRLSQSGDYARSNVFTAIRTVATNLQETGVADGRATLIVFTDGPDDSVTYDPAAAASQEDAAAVWRSNLTLAVSSAREANARVIVLHLDSGIGPDGVSTLAPDDRNAVPFPRDRDGRTGPLEAYAELACQTGGHYFYLRDPRALPAWFDTVEYLFDGHWSAELQTPLADPSGAYFLGAEFRVSIGERSKGAALGQLGLETSYGLAETDDNRLLLWRP